MKLKILYMPCSNNSHNTEILRKSEWKRHLYLSCLQSSSSSLTTMGVDVHVIVVGLIQGVGGRYVYHKTMNFKEKQ